MKNIEVFQQFARKSLKPVKATKGGNGVAYTRVSTKDQEDGYSLEIQLESIQEYAKKQGLQIVEYFGGKYESAQTDKERKEFNRMLQFIKKSKEKISYVFVYDVSRFSRTGINGAFIKESLRHEGIDLVTVNQPVDTSNPGGRLQQNIQFIFSEYDNDLRREKCTGGMRAKLLQGYWIGRAPLGYDIVTKHKEQIATINEKGKIIKQAFHWKADGVTNKEILERLEARGIKIYNQHLQWIFNNVFYCGMISHGILGSQVVEGKHPALVSKEVFLKVHDIQVKNKHSKHKKEFPHVPLKHFVKCAECGTPFAGYEVKKKRLHYYKCNKTGCKLNRSAIQLNKKFQSKLQEYSFDEKLITSLKSEAINVYHEMNASNVENAKLIKVQLNEINSKIEKVEERYVYGEINQELYQKFLTKLREEKKEIQGKLQEVDFELSNLENYIDFSLMVASKIPVLWGFDDYEIKEEVQNILFPPGILYDRKIEDYRTIRVNAVFKLTSCLAKVSEGDEKKSAGKNPADKVWWCPLESNQ